MRGVRFESASSRPPGIPLRRLAGLLAKVMPAFQQEGTPLVNHGCAACDRPVPNPMDRLQIKLVVRLDRNESHVLSTNRFRDGFVTNEVVLVRLHERLHELRRNQLNVVTLLSQNTAQKVRSRAGFQTDQGGRHVRG